MKSFPIHSRTACGFFLSLSLVIMTIASLSFADAMSGAVGSERGCGGDYSHPSLDSNGHLVSIADSLPLLPALGEFSVLVIMCRFASHAPADQVTYTFFGSQFQHPDPVTVAMADTLIFDNRFPAPWNVPQFLFDPVWRWENYDGVSVNDYFRAVSNDRMRITGEVTGPYVLDDLDGSSFFFELFGPALDSAIADGFNIQWANDPVPTITGGDWDRVMIIHPKYLACSNCAQGGVRFGDIVWVNGSMSYFALLVHELAHSFEIKHSNGWFCAQNSTWPTSDDTSCGIGIISDPYDPMSKGRGHFNVRVKEKLAWIDPEQVQTITESGAYVLTPLQTASGLKALRIPRDTSYYYYQFRAPLDFDEFILKDPFSDTRTDGLYGLRVDASNLSFDNFLLDMPPLTNSNNQSTNRVTLLEIGNTYVDSVIGVSVHVASLTGIDTAAQLTVEVDILNFGDYDGDGILNGDDNCLVTENSAQLDTDLDGVGDLCDVCPGFDDAIDLDSNGIPDGCDICCDTPGDSDNNGQLNIADVTYLIARIFAGGPAPPCNDEGDADGNNTVNIADVTFLISRIFAGGPAPACGTTGV